MTPRQCDLFDPLIGLLVVMPYDRRHGTHAFIGPNRTLCCACHGAYRGRLPECEATRITRHIDEFGTPTVPFTLVSSVSHQEED